MEVNGTTAVGDYAIGRSVLGISSAADTGGRLEHNTDFIEELDLLEERALQVVIASDNVLTALRGPVPQEACSGESKGEPRRRTLLESLETAPGKITSRLNQIDYNLSEIRKVLRV